MKKVFLLLATLVAANCIGGEMDRKSRDEGIQVFYIPFSTETYAPVTPDSIEQDADCVFSLAVPGVDADAILHPLQQTTAGSFDEQVVRLRIANKEDGWEVLVDREGGVRRDMGQGALTREAFMTLKTVLLRLIGERPDSCQKSLLRRGTVEPGDD